MFTPLVVGMYLKQSYFHYHTFMSILMDAYHLPVYSSPSLVWPCLINPGNWIPQKTPRPKYQKYVIQSSLYFVTSFLMVPTVQPRRTAHTSTYSSSYALNGLSLIVLRPIQLLLCRTVSEIFSVIVFSLCVPTVQWHLRRSAYFWSYLEARWSLQLMQTVFRVITVVQSHDLLR
jgi:hypothetical protein